METYEAIREWKDQHITAYLNDSVSLNNFHDQVMQQVLDIAKSNVKKGAPCDFTWFITGSGGRFEQSIISDQDHGIVYEISNEENDAYFKALGEEVSYGLHIAGYPYCVGKIMSSNSVWCKSFHGWQIQLAEWMENKSWESIRHLQIFYDARVLRGRDDYIQHLKSFIYHHQLTHPPLLGRFIANVKHVKNVIGPVGQILVERHGVYQGCVNLKYAAFLPYVNAVRLLAIKEGIYETSTLERIARLLHINGYEKILQNSEGNFSTLLTYRLSLFQIESYSDTHYFNMEKLTKNERKEIKQILKDGKRLHEDVINYLLK